MQAFDNLADIDLQQLLSHLALLLIAFVLALPIGWNRERSQRGFGLRTFPIVAVVSCGFMLLGLQVIDSTEGEARVLAGIITGIGFIGGGAILSTEHRVEGTSTAASIWNTGAIGVSVAFSRLEIAIVLSVLNFLALRLLAGSIKERVRESGDDVD